jgi:hypothetical protein
MWHQVVLAFYRYTISDSITTNSAIVLSIIIIALSLFSYYFIEKLFRDKKKISLKFLVIIVVTLSSLTTLFALYIYKNAGVLHDIPELEISKNNVKRNMHALYNDRIYEMDKDFSNTTKIKILIIGNSFARDWANILLESKYKDKIEISYVFDIYQCANINNRLSKAEFIYLAASNEAPSYLDLAKIISDFNINKKKTWIVGTKNFGKNNGSIYNKRGESGYCDQKIYMREGYFVENVKMKNRWKDRYIDLISLIINKERKIPVFTPGCKFISQDSAHLTHAGAVYYADLIENKIRID